MSLPIITADQRLAERRGVKGVLVGKSGIGKTSQLWTLKPMATLFFDLEAGDLAVEGWAGDTIRPRTWQECRDFAVYIGGPNPALRDDQPFSQAHFNAVCALWRSGRTGQVRHRVRRFHHRGRSPVPAMVQRPAQAYSRRRANPTAGARMG